ncbi:hypothetical protein [Acidovorax soli]|uniref:hypothetical protein n=1 Tax=Acidovorax soli TaxID=592050 RepID=UPI001114FA41|nr:hypothetical protein [Acidovorax soli]
MFKDPMQTAHYLNLQRDMERANLSNTNQALNSGSIQAQNVQLQQEVARLQGENQYYRQLLCKPMNEIAEKNGNFKETYEKQMEIMADWMVSQKAFKELAIQFGFEKGQSAQETIQQAKDLKTSVIQGKNNPDHKTNADEFIFKHSSK